MKLLSKSIYLPLLTLSSCATIINGTTQPVGIFSNPANATVYVDNMFIGDTPICAHMSRRDSHMVHIELEGYQPYDIVFNRRLSGWVFGNIAFGGFIGLAIDAISGSMFRLTPEQIQAEMHRENIYYSNKTEESFIMIVLQPDPAWEKIGTLEPT